MKNARSVGELTRYKTIDQNLMGRPSKYNKDMQARAELYLADGFRDNGKVIPSAEGLAKYLGVASSTVYLWGEEHALFSETLEAIQAEQKEITLNEGLKGEFNATIAKLVLANHGMHDKADTTTTMNVTVEQDAFDVG